jgi:hypothetical protein
VKIQTTTVEESEMIQLHSIPNREQFVDTMIGLTNLSHRHRTIVAGSDQMELSFALQRRGFIRVTTTATCRTPSVPHAVGLITEQNAPSAVETALAELPRFLCPSAAIAVLIDTRESGSALRIRNKLTQMGFRIEAGVRCQQGLVLSAHRQNFAQLENAA